MATTYDLIAEDFLEDLQAISDLVALVASGGGSAKSRVASINSATLLLAATFEEFVREMGRQYAREVVLRAGNIASLPKKLTATAWKRALEEMARAKIDSGAASTPLTSISSEARSSLESMCKFLDGDMSQDIYKHIAHNENNMRPGQLNAIFKVSDLGGFCDKVAISADLGNYFQEDIPGKVSAKLSDYLNDFMDRRNEIAHSLNPGSSAGQDQFLKDVGFIRSLAKGMAWSLPQH